MNHRLIAGVAAGIVGLGVASPMAFAANGSGAVRTSERTFEEAFSLQARLQKTAQAL